MHFSPMLRFQLPIIFLVLLLTDCAAPTPITSTAPQNTATPAAASPTTQKSTIPTLESVKVTVEPTQQSIFNTTTIILEEIKKSSSTSALESMYLPNLWTKIEKYNISVFAYDQLTDYTYADDGSLWAVGGFGVLHRTPGGRQTLYSIENDLHRQFFTRVAISPSGEVWVGGTENALVRYDGTQWINEGEGLPLPNDDRVGWLCYSKNISGIDFGPDDEAWVMNNGLEIYVQVYGQWANFPFPKEILPWAGGGGCPLGLRVLSETDITIKRSGCCMGSPVGYHFDGESWQPDADYAVVDEIISTRHRLDADELYTILGNAQETDLINPPLNKWLPRELYPSQDYGYKITSDKDGIIWISGGLYSYLYNNASGSFINAQDTSRISEDADITQSELVNFGTKVFYYQPGKKPVSLQSLIQDSIGFLYIYTASTRFAVDQEGRIWLYSPEKGLIMIEDGNAQYFGMIPGGLTPNEIGGILVLQDGRVWVGSTGSVWEYQDDQWMNYLVSGTDDLFLFIAEDKNGAVYGATNTAVYTFNGETFLRESFITQNRKPLVISENGELGDCSFHRNYIVVSNCPGTWGITSREFHYYGLYLGVQDDGSVTFVNNRIVARREKDGEWKSFLFDDFAIDSATVDKDGNIWIFSNSDGLIRLAPEIFDDYQELLYE